MKVKLTKERTGPDGILPAGTEISDPHAWRLCLLGLAEPSDDEASAKVTEANAIATRDAEYFAARAKAEREEMLARLEAKFAPATPDDKKGQ